MRVTPMRAGATERGESRLLIAIVVALLCGVVSGVAQVSESPWMIGATLGYGFANHAVTGVRCQSDCPQYNGGIGGGMLLGAMLERALGDGFGVALRTRYVFSSVTMQTITSDAKVKDENGNVVPWVRNYSLTANVPEFLFDLSATYSIGSFGMHVGGGAGFLISPTWESGVQSISPGNILYGNHRSDTAFFPKQSIDGVRPQQYHVSLGAAYTLPVSHTARLEPGITVYVPLVSISDVTRWKETIIELSVTFKFGMGESGGVSGASNP